MRYNENGKLLLTTENAIFHKNKIWFTEYSCNELYCYDVFEKKIHLVTKFNNENEYQSRLFKDIVVGNNKLYMIPFAANSLYELDCETQYIKKIDIPNVSKVYNNFYYDVAKFGSGHFDGDSIFLVATTYPAIIEYNSKTEEIISHTNWIQEFINLFGDKNLSFFRNTILVNDKIYAPSCISNYVLEFDTRKKTHVWHKVGSEKCTYSSICVKDGEFWLSPYNDGPIVQWDVNKNIWREYNNYPKGYKKCQSSFGDIKYFNEYLYCIPYKSMSIIRINSKERELEDYYPCMENLGECCACIVEDKLYIFSSNLGSALVLDSFGNILLEEMFMEDEWQKYHENNYQKRGQQLNKKVGYKEVELIEKFTGELLEYFNTSVNKKEIYKKSVIGYEIMNNILNK